MYDTYVKYEQDHSSCPQQQPTGFSTEDETSTGSRLEDRKALRLAKFKQWLQ